MSEGEVWAIVGSRGYKNHGRMSVILNGYIRSRGRPRLVVSGGARGADTLGISWASLNGIPHRTHYPQWAAHGKSAGPIRNRMIVREADIVFAFINKNMTRGTKSTVDIARELGVKCIVVGDVE